MGLMKQELEYVEGIIKAGHLHVSKPKPLRPDPIANFRVGWNVDKLASLKRRRERAWNWQKAGLDRRIRETEQHIKRVKEEASTRAAALHSYF
jgi:hypothetical protein